eukprot:13074952-Alexandrium_andersonii.AAC.1
MIASMPSPCSTSSGCSRHTPSTIHSSWPGTFPGRPAIALSCASMGGHSCGRPLGSCSRRPLQRKSLASSMGVVA